MRFYLLVISIMVVGLNVHACDVCGGSVTGFGNGSLTSYKYDFISMSWSNQSFKQVGSQSQGSLDFINSFNASAQFHINNRLRVYGNVSSGYKFRYQNEGKTSVSGMGDTQLGFSYIILNQFSVSDKVDISIDLGGSIVVPIGEFDSNIHEANVPLNFNIGRGNFAFNFNPLVHLDFQVFGIIANTQWLINTPTSEGYTFGNQSTFSSVIYKAVSTNNDLEFIPNIGLQFEKSNDDTFANSKTVDDTGSHAYLLQAGIQIKKAAYSLGVTYYKTMSQNYSNGMSTSSGRLSTQFFYFF